MKLKLRDLGLSYEGATHGVQTAIKFRMETEQVEENKSFVGRKHMRTGIDMSKADMLGLATLLIDKGIITPEEYMEAMRLAANNELAMHEDEANANGGPKITFR